MRRRLHRSSESLSWRASQVRADRSGAVFAVRLVLSFAAALTLVGVVGYVFMNHRLHEAQIDRFAEAQRSYATTFERYGATSESSARAIRRINRVLDALGGQDGALETLLIDDTGIVRASAEFLQNIDERVPSGYDTIQGGQGFGLGRPAEEISPAPAMSASGDFPMAA